MRRVVVNGMGIVSSIGNNTQEVLSSLYEARSGIIHAESYAELGFRCQVHGQPKLDPAEIVDRRAMRFHATGTGWNHVAMDQAILDSGLEESDISNERTGIIRGSRYYAQKYQPKADWTFCGAKVDVVNGVGNARDMV